MKTVTLTDEEAARAISVLQLDAECGDEPYHELSMAIATKIATAQRYDDKGEKRA